MAPTIIPARSGAYVYLKKGETLRVTNQHGHQVVDTWAFVLPDSPSSTQPSPTDRSAFSIEFMSMCHTRAALNAIRPTVGNTLVSNRRKPMLTLTKDTSSGVHDTLIAACDIYRYQGLIPSLGECNYHENCSDNLQWALKCAAERKEEQDEWTNAVKVIREGLRGWTPDPFNLFMNIPWEAESKDGKGAIGWEPPRSDMGSFVELRAERDVVVGMSACPQDVLTINGGLPVDASYEVI